ncbi:MAG: pyroglutamyl-peptidase I [Candidatus Rokuibacteriota bacterium]|nr:MAG: pyroglutamyl-peptidase I [Candidatus Rokubacteria bacterium]PYM64951.1 MAG: pyroglutamyl-peptidase I [Candidatus Rokubacteria bacterium]PYN70676.1 MAG: pyroglutamyl-peptidase I [Candidatus Rokubacteria bacterium]
MAAMRDRTILVTGFEPFGAYSVNPSEGLAKAVDGRRFGACAARGAVLPVHHADAARQLEALLAETGPSAVVHLGLAAGRARVALERVAVNVMDYDEPDRAGFQASGGPIAPDGPVAYFATLPLAAILHALTAEGIPAYVSNTAGTYLCNQTLYTTLHAVRQRPDPPTVGLIHVPLLPAMVAATGLEQPSMDFPLMLRAVELALGVVASSAA